MIGATGTQPIWSPIASFPSGVPSQDCANPIQQVPNPAAQADSIKFSAAKAQFSITHWLSVTLEITISTGA
jgi:hypothetical protein